MRQPTLRPAIDITFAVRENKPRRLGTGLAIGRCRALNPSPKFARSMWRWQSHTALCHGSRFNKPHHFSAALNCPRNTAGLFQSLDAAVCHAARSSYHMQILIQLLLYFISHMHELSNAGKRQSEPPKKCRLCAWVCMRNVPKKSSLKCRLCRACNAAQA